MVLERLKQGVKTYEEYAAEAVDDDRRVTMYYKKFRSLNLSALGLGALRLPMEKDNQTVLTGKKDEKSLTSHCPSGINYIDTSLTSPQNSMGQLIRIYKPCLKNSSSVFRQIILIFIFCMAWMKTSFQTIWIKIRTNLVISYLEQ